MLFVLSCLIPDRSSPDDVPCALPRTNPLVRSTRNWRGGGNEKCFSFPVSLTARHTNIPVHLSISFRDIRCWGLPRHQRYRSSLVHLGRHLSRYLNYPSDPPGHLAKMKFEHYPGWKGRPHIRCVTKTMVMVTRLLEHFESG